MSKNWTFALLKPDAVANPISLGWLLDALNKNGLIIEMGCRLNLSIAQASELYSFHKNSFYFNRSINHLCSGPVVAMKLILNEDEQNLYSKDEALKRWRRLLGPSKFGKMYLAQVGDLDEMTKMENFRQLFGLSDSRNFGHGSSSLEELEKEYSIFEKYMKKIEDPYSELFKLDKYMLIENDKEKENNFQKFLNFFK
uniref:NDK domain-containing protein n=1 Tax=Meloidogyne hapla TaxID=6305 RepID=A0A1I8C0V5_MELHA